MPIRYGEILGNRLGSPLKHGGERHTSIKAFTFWMNPFWFQVHSRVFYKTEKG